MKISFGTMEFVLFIEHLLSMKSNSKHTLVTMEERTEIIFTGDKDEVQKEIFDWLKVRREDK
jgi:hypothetical protein